STIAASHSRPSSDGRSVRLVGVSVCRSFMARPPFGARGLTRAGQFTPSRQCLLWRFESRLTEFTFYFLLLTAEDRFVRENTSASLLSVEFRGPDRVYQSLGSRIAPFT